MSFKLVLAALFLSFFGTHVAAQNNWDGDHAVGNFSAPENWYGNTLPTNWNSTTDLNFNFNNANHSSNYFDFNGFRTIRSLVIASTYNGSSVLDADVNSGFDFWWKVENYSGYAQTIATPISFKGTGIELNPIYGDLTFTKPIYNGVNANYLVYGDAGKKLSLNDVPYGSGSTAFNIKGYSIVEVNYNSSNSFGGAFTVEKGELWVNASGAVRGDIYIGNNSANTCKIFISHASTATTVANQITVQTSGGTIGSLNSSNTHTYSGPIYLNSNTINLHTVGAGTLSFTGAISNTGGVKKIGVGTVVYAASNSYTGTTTITEGVLQYGAANTISNSSAIALDGGTFSTGATTGFSDTVGTLQLTNSSTIALGTGVHTLSFAASNGVSWTPSKTLTITGWDGCNGKIVVGTSSTSLTSTQLAQITFSGFSAGAALLATGELIPASSLGTTSANQTICKNSALSSISISSFSGSIVKWQYASDAAFTTGVTDIVSTSSTLTASVIGNITATRYFRAVLQMGAGSCTTFYSNVVSVTVNKTTYSNGSWSTTPSSSLMAVFSSNFTSSGDLSVCSCQVTGTAAVTLNSGHNLTVAGEVNVGASASLTFENTASLVQTDASATNSGNVVYKRTTSALTHNFDYVYWGSPVQSQTLSAIWMVDDGYTFYSFNSSINDWAAASGNTVMTPGTGYIARASSGNGGWTTNATWQSVFNGVPNNGTLTTSIYKSGATNINNLISNPYPSALDLESFYEDNASVLNPTFYFWTHNTVVTNGAYTASDYALYNAVLGAGVGTGTAAVSGGSAPDRYVDAGQGFFAEGVGTGGTASFKNTHRVLNNNNGFYRHSNASMAVQNKHLLWLNLSNSEGLFKQQLLGYVEGASNALDELYDANSFEGNPYADFYSVVGSEKCVIQSRQWPFDPADSVPLGYSATFSGSVSISIDHFDAFFDTQNIYLEDTLLGVMWDLKQGPYVFSTTDGIFNSRFKIRYLTDLQLGTATFAVAKKVQVVYGDSQIRVLSPNSGIVKITLYNLLGQKVIEQNCAGLNQFRIDTLLQESGVWLLKVALQNGQTQTIQIKS